MEQSSEPSAGSSPGNSPGPGWWRRTGNQDAYDHARRLLHRPMLVLTLVFTAGLVLEVRQDLSAAAEIAVRATNVVIWAAFVAEYLWLLRLSPDRRHYVRTHPLELLIVIIPVLRPLRALRLVRLLAVAARSWHQVFSVLRHRGLGKIISAVASLMLVGGVISFALEPETFGTVGDAVWWVLVTSTTVGYGDFAPVGLGARAVAVLVMVLGIGLVGVITANIVDFFLTEQRAGAAGTDESGPEPGCPSCQQNAEHLARIEAQLAHLLATASPTAPTDQPATSAETPDPT